MSATAAVSDLPQASSDVSEVPIADKSHLKRQRLRIDTASGRRRCVERVISYVSNEVHFVRRRMGQ